MNKSKNKNIRSPIEAKKSWVEKAFIVIAAGSIALSIPRIVNKLEHDRSAVGSQPPDDLRKAAAAIARRFNRTDGCRIDYIQQNPTIRSKEPDAHQEDEAIAIKTSLQSTPESIAYINKYSAMDLKNRPKATMQVEFNLGKDGDDRDFSYNTSFESQYIIAHDIQGILPKAFGGDPLSVGIYNKDISPSPDESTAIGFRETIPQDERGQLRALYVATQVQASYPDPKTGGPGGVLTYQDRAFCGFIDISNDGALRSYDLPKL